MESPMFIVKRATPRERPRVSKDSKHDPLAEDELPPCTGVMKEEGIQLCCVRECVNEQQG